MFVLVLFAKPLDLTLQEFNLLVPETHTTFIQSKEIDLNDAACPALFL